MKEVAESSFRANLKYISRCLMICALFLILLASIKSFLVSKSAVRLASKPVNKPALCKAIPKVDTDISRISNYKTWRKVTDEPFFVQLSAPGG